MKSTITRLYDYTQTAIPEELCHWHIPEEEIDAQLETLSRNHAFEAEADTVQNGDSVACRGESEAERWNRETLLFYPGHGLCDPALEDACLGARVGESRTAQTPEGVVTLTVKRIVRRSLMPVGDELVRLENIGGVETAEDYRRWFRAQREDFTRKQALYRCASFLLGEIQSKSDIYIDPQEKDAWLKEWVDSMYDAFLAAGIDPKIPSEGFDFLTEEQAKEKMYKEQERAFDAYVVQSYIAEKLTGRSMDDICKEGLEKLAAENGMTVEALRATSCDAMIYGKFAMETAMEQLGAYAEPFLEV